MDITVTKLFPSGAYEISTMDNGYLQRKVYCQYTKRDAVAEFKRERSNVDKPKENTMNTIKISFAILAMAGLSACSHVAVTDVHFVDGVLTQEKCKVLTLGYAVPTTFTTGCYQEAVK